MKKTLRILLILLTAYCTSYAQISKNDSLKFSGRVIVLNAETTKMKLYVGYGKDDSFGAANANWTIVPKINKDGFFKFSLPNFKKPYFVDFTLDIDNGSEHGIRMFDHFYYSEPGDDIYVNFTVDPSYTAFKRSISSVFQGKGAEKYNVAWRLQKPFFFDEYFPDLQKMQLSSVKDSADIDNKLNHLTETLGKYKLKRDSLIASSNISPKMRKILRYEYGAFRKGLSYEWAYRHSLIYNKYPNYRAQIVKNYFLHNQEFIERPDSLARYARFFVEEVLMRTSYESMFTNHGNPPTIRNFYNIIINKYDDAFRDRLLGLLLKNDFFAYMYQPVNIAAQDSIVKKAYDLVKLPYVKSALKERNLALRRMLEPIYNGEFTMLNGTKLKLESLKGKVVLLDVWFNGCWGCADFHQKFEKVYPKFKNNGKFVVLSVNVDKDKNRWIKGIESKLYTSKDYIQVTTGNWFDHPFMKYYNITGASYVMVIGADGMVLPNVDTYEQVTDQITSALKKVDKSK